MAQPKQLKKLTRERMERTGESYTTARKALLDGRPERPSARPAPAGTPIRAGGPAARSGQPAADPHELPEYPAPAEVTQYDAGLWHRVLTQAGVAHPLTGQPLSEALLAGLAGGIGFMVFVFDDASTTTATVVTRAHPEPYTANLLTRSGAKVREQKTGSARLAAQYLDAGLDAGRAVVVRVSRASLPWMEIGIADEDEPVDVAVLGEHDEGELIIDDGSGELQLIAPETLAAARSRLKALKNWQTWVPSSGGPDVETLKRNILQAIEETTGRLLGTSDLNDLPAHFAPQVGITGLRTWVGQLRDTTSAQGWTGLLSEPGRLAHALDTVVEFLTDGRYGGPGGLRGLYADFLDEASELPGLERLAECSPDYRAVAGQWDELTDMIDPDIDPDERSGHFAAIADRVEPLAVAEENAATRLVEVLATISE
ncbi:DUF4872 domain-containing protein [Arthrobacter rhombi]|uniref:DUF4872 domain-containing protein n=1 Tax=Arthrobacter rhombi TaxID=71253 RepID=UPI003FD3903F